MSSNHTEELGLFQCTPVDFILARAATSCLQNRSIDIADLIVTTAAIAIAVAEYARRWFR